MRIGIAFNSLNLGFPSATGNIVIATPKCVKCTFQFPQSGISFCDGRLSTVRRMLLSDLSIPSIWDFLLRPAGSSPLLGRKGLINLLSAERGGGRHSAWSFIRSPNSRWLISDPCILPSFAASQGSEAELRSSSLNGYVSGGTRCCPKHPRKLHICWLWWAYCLSCGYLQKSMFWSSPLAFQS